MDHPDESDRSERDDLAASDQRPREPAAGGNGPIFFKVPENIDEFDHEEMKAFARTLLEALAPSPNPQVPEDARQEPNRVIADEDEDFWPRLARHLLATGRVDHPTEGTIKWLADTLHSGLFDAAWRCMTIQQQIPPTAVLDDLEVPSLEDLERYPGLSLEEAAAGIAGSEGLVILEQPTPPPSDDSGSSEVTSAIVLHALDSGIGPVTVLSESGPDARYGTLEEALRTDDRLAFTPGLKIVTFVSDDIDLDLDWLLETGRYPASRWANTMAWPSGDVNEWELCVDGEPVLVRINDERLDYGNRPTLERYGVVLQLDTRKSSMSTGDIGTTLRIDKHGGWFLEEWGYAWQYLGVLEGSPDPLNLIYDHTLGTQMTGVLEFSTEVLDAEELRSVVRRAVKAGLSGVQSGCEVRLQGESHTLEDFLGQT